MYPLLIMYNKDMTSLSECTIIRVWLLLNGKWAILQQYHWQKNVHFDEIMMSFTLYWTNILRWRFIVLAYYSGYIINISVRKVMADFLNPLTDHILHIQIAQKSEMWSFFKEHHIPSVTNTSRYFRLVISNDAPWIKTQNLSSVKDA
jgi:hypothetical protein